MGRNFENITQGIVFKGFAMVFFTISGFILSIILNRVFGKDQYGYLVLMFSVTSFCVGFMDLGLRQSLSRFVPKYIEEKNIPKVKSILTVSLVLISFSILLFSALILIFSGVISKGLLKKPELDNLLKIGVLFFIGVSISEVLSEVFQAFQDWKREVIVSLGYPLVYLCLSSLCIFMFKFDIRSVIISNLIAALIVFVFSFDAIKAFWAPRIGAIEFWSNAKEIFLFGFPIILVNVNFYLLMWFDKLVLGRYYDSGSLAEYYIAFTFYGALMILIKVLYTVLRPYFSTISVYIDDNILMRQKFTFIFRWIMHLTILISIGAFFLIKPVIEICYGMGYGASISAFRLLLLVYILRAVGNPLGIYTVNVLGATKRTAVISTVLTLSIICFDLILIPRYGYKGAILAAVGGYVIWWGSVFVLFKEFIKLVPYRSIFKAIIACGIITALNYSAGSFVNLSEIFRAILSLTGYAAILYLIKEIESGDIIILSRIKEYLMRSFFKRGKVKAG